MRESQTHSPRLPQETSPPCRWDPGDTFTGGAHIAPESEGNLGAMSPENTLMKPTHIPVLLAELVDCLELNEGASVIDVTIGLGGHAAAVLTKIGATGRLLGLERSEEGLIHAREALAEFGGQAHLVHGNFRDLLAIAKDAELDQLDAIYFDLGLASWQIDQGYQGLSFQLNGPLDMRIEAPAHQLPVLGNQLQWTNDERLLKCVRKWQGKPASNFINEASEQELGDVFRELGGVRSWRQVAQHIIGYRQQQPVETTLQLSAATQATTPGLLAPLFQALRILVNDEYGALATGLMGAWQLLKPGGRLAVISFHSGEHRIVKQLLRELSGVSSISRIFPSTAEQAANPRSRSATLRFIQKPIITSHK